MIDWHWHLILARIHSIYFLVKHIFSNTFTSELLLTSICLSQLYPKLPVLLYCNETITDALYCVICVCVSESLLLCIYLSYIRLFFDATIIMVNKDFHYILLYYLYYYIILLYLLLNLNILPIQISTQVSTSNLNLWNRPYLQAYDINSYSIVTCYTSKGQV